MKSITNKKTQATYTSPELDLIAVNGSDIITASRISLGFWGDEQDFSKEYEEGGW